MHPVKLLLWCWHRIWVPVQVLVMSFPIQLLIKVPEKTVKDDECAPAPEPVMGHQRIFGLMALVLHGNLRSKLVNANVPTAQ